MILSEGQVRDMLHTVITRPLMWAATREAYAATLSTLLTVLGHDGRAVYRVLPHTGPALLDPGAVLDDEWADKLATQVRKILGE